MQAINHSLHNINKIFDDFEHIYTITSTKNPNGGIIKPVINEAFRSVFKTFSAYGCINYPVEFKSAPYKPLRSVGGKKTVIVCFSGGKDSTATAIHYKQAGYKVYLYHLKGINLTYKDEWESAQAVAEKLEVPLIFEEVRLSGKQEWTEHPLKNMILANMALQYGIRNKLTTNIAFGCFTTSSLELEPFGVCAGDCKEMWEAYNEVMQAVIPDFKVLTPFSNFQDTLDILIDNKDIVPYTQSCIGAYRYREYLKKQNESKYNIQLPEHRCGSCWKCCLEYCIFCDNGLYEYNEAYYRHCLEVLRNTLKKETGVTYSVDSTWEHYFFYDKEQSKYYG